MNEENKPTIDDYEDRMAAPIGAISTGRRPIPPDVAKEQEGKDAKMEN